MNSKFFRFKKQKCYDFKDQTIIIVDADDDHDFECEGFKSPRAFMSCGHVVTPMSLTKWCQHLLAEGQSRFFCGQTNCDAEWSYTEVRKMALLTTKEKKYFEKTLALNAARNLFGTKPVSTCLKKA
uniref:Uncharacterized protein n=1 Tax=Poecilia reticulata TaxID=8081 RepID=A0A3P9NCP2_POERE